MVVCAEGSKVDGARFEAVTREVERMRKEGRSLLERLRVVSI